MPHGFALLNEAAGHCQLALAGRVGTANQQHMVLAAQHGVHRHKHRRVGRCGPGVAVAAQHAPLFLQRGVVLGAGELLQRGDGAGGNLRCQGREGLAHGVGRGVEVRVADGGGVHLALAGQVDEGPAREGAQVAAGGVFEVAHQRDARPRRSVLRHTGPHRLHPNGFVVIVAHRQHLYTGAV